ARVGPRSLSTPQRAPVARRPARAADPDPALRASAPRRGASDERRRPLAPARRGRMTISLDARSWPCLIGGKEVWSDATMQVLYPSANEVVGTVPLLGSAQVRRTLELASAARVELDRYDRSTILERIATAIDEHADELAHLITRESGLCLKDTRHEVVR